TGDVGVAQHGVERGLGRIHGLPSGAGDRTFVPASSHLGGRLMAHGRVAGDQLRPFPIRERLFGTIDFKQARWLPMSYGLVPQALMVDSKAKKTEEQNRLDLQMS